ncbi:uroporphyrinogen-III synthase [Paracoccus sp. (in: a-proteobacteria)]|uniref:uroporphyrinogen-III synthase n=1 Tax=Paracoccus sp. TaxID=267 RepID=UPI003A875566
MPSTLLLTRPQADSRRFQAMLPGVRAVISPILRIEPVAHDADRLRAAGGFVFTSAHAVPAAGPGQGRLALCVGKRTAQVAREAGFSVREGKGFAESLLPLIRAAPVPLLHLHGRHVARTLPVEGVVVYDQVAEPLNADARALLSGPGRVLLPLFSARSARLVAAQVSDAAALLFPVAVSPAVMQAWAGPMAGQAVARFPTAEAMVAAIRRLMADEQS